jgi:formylglycine-generating enzyme required for sulfatase activity
MYRFKKGRDALLTLQDARGGLVMRHRVFRLALILMLLAIDTHTQAEVVLDTVEVGNAGNAGELSGSIGFGTDAIVGGVDYAYRIGKYEVTAGQYRDFLNAVDPSGSNPYGLYNSNMDSNDFGCQITWNPVGSTYDFSGRPSGIEADWVNRPVNMVNWGDAVRFANWLHNGQPTGQLTGDPIVDAGLTEDGSYFLNGAMTVAELMAVVRKLDATWVITSEDEWYKAAYHKNDGTTGNYFEYPMSSDSIPGNDCVDPDPGNSGNFFINPTDYTIGIPFWRTEVGKFDSSESAYDTFDQGGNVREWNEAVITGVTRGSRGGGFLDATDSVNAPARNDQDPTLDYLQMGFRVARPRPSGSCCLPDATCVTHLSQSDCELASGTYGGMDSKCACPAGLVPTVGEWGLLVMVGAILIAATTIFARRRTEDHAVNVLVE